MSQVQGPLEEVAEDFFGLPHISAHFTPTFVVFSWAPSARESAWQVATGDSLRRAEAEAAVAKFARPKIEFERDGSKTPQLWEQFLVIITCRDEKQQVELLGRFQGEGLECKALVGLHRLAKE